MIRIIAIMMLGLLMGCTASQEAPALVEVMEEATPEVTPEPTEHVVVPDTAISRGEALFKMTRIEVGFACATCHYTNSDRRLIGPGLINMTERFLTYGLEIDINTYLHESIIAPTNFIVPDEPAYPANVMPQTYQDVFTEAEIEDIIAYILSL